MRNMLAEAGGSTGRALFDAAVRGGAAALGVNAGGLAVGALADVVTLDPEHPALVAKHGDAVLDAWIFGERRGGRSQRRNSVPREYALLNQLRGKRSTISSGLCWARRQRTSSDV